MARPRAQPPGFDKDSPMQPLTNIAVTAARRAGDVILGYYRRGDTGEVTAKSGRNDFVTEADQRAENAIIDTISRVYPDHAFMAEESGESGDSETVWIIDPIDGTANFMAGIPHFCVSIACQVNGVIEHAVIYDPVKDELFTADRGAGASLDGKRIRVTRTVRLRQALLATGFAYRKKHDIATHMPVFNRLLSASADVRRAGSAALDLAYVAAGRLDGFWEMGLAPWDMAAGLLLVRGAGGIAGDIKDQDPLQTGNVIAANPKLYPQLIEKIERTPRGGS
ncbi:inositol monophosphatase family protein [Salinisphaera sp.]|uniref:inositol monophosphatase family protein n=2 Tax=Gammaproteobacteria TaxID=1236 RepID=UPI0025DB1225|nr:inositol monophosphatase family protein [Salinisphaera sp.]|tara:strand:- start:101 stop:940 length:840 start_codon:yes stop_codon:yes gene_type:complete